jgi:MarC family membrane protein
MDTSFLSATILLILITDPLGNIPLFISALRQVRAERRRVVIFREVLIAFTALLVFMVFGKHFLSVLHLTDQALSVAGGVILLLIAIRMIFPEHGTRLGDDEHKEEPFIVPIAIPLIAGPSAMATVLLLSSREPGRMFEWIGALSISMAVTAVVFALSTRLQKTLGEQAITALERLMGLVLTAISVEMLLSGVATYIRQFQR